ncbi:MAG: hypothetical protein H6755_04035 [Candidatus Omnitrophica bacterium]|nr:hypothetical protein [Candidatus Omnitrophota bacterium]MCB9747559.1 hypothetical protein [Candidatus Omnitrophota bacterium]
MIQNKLKDRKESEDPVQEMAALRKKIKLSLISWSFRYLLILPGVLFCYVMAFDDPDLAGNVIMIFLITFLCVLPYLSIVISWILYFIQQYIWAQKVIATPFYLLAVIFVIGVFIEFLQ